MIRRRVPPDRLEPGDGVRLRGQRVLSRPTAALTLDARPPDCPAGTFRRVELAYARSNPTIVYASVDVNGGSIYKSTTAAPATRPCSTAAADYLGGQGWYDNALWVDPTNANISDRRRHRPVEEHQRRRVLHPDQQVAGAPASAHADHHAIVEHPGFNGTTNRTVFFANDGGIYRTNNVYTVGGGDFAVHGWLDRPQQQSRHHAVLRRRRATRRPA